MNFRRHFARLWHPDDILDSLWSVCASPYTALLILVSLSALIGLSVMLPQEPLSASASAAGNAAWLSSIRERYGRSVDWLHAIGLLDVAHSLWLRGLLGLLAFSALLGVLDLARPRQRPGGAGLDATTLTGEVVGAEAGKIVTSRVLAVLRSARYRVLSDGSGALHYADRFALFPLLAYCGLLLSIAGLALSERTAWWEDKLALRPGQVRTIGHGTDLAIRAEVIQPGADETTSTPMDYRVRLTFLHRGDEVADWILRKDVPFYHGGLVFYAVGTEQALLVQARDPGGRALSMRTPETGAAQFTEVALRFHKEETSRYIVMLAPGAAPGRYFSQSANERYILVPDRNLTLRLSHSTAVVTPVLPLFQVEAFRSAERSPFYVRQVSGAGSLEIAGDTYVLTPRQNAVIKMGQDYGALLAVAGAIVLLLSLALTAWRPMQRIWLTVRPGADVATLEIAVADGPWADSCPPRGDVLRQLEGLLRTPQAAQHAQEHAQPVGDR